MVARLVLSARLRIKLHIAATFAIDILFCSLVIAVLVQLGLLVAALPASLDNALCGGPLARASATASKQLRRKGSRQHPSSICDTVYSPSSSSFFDDISSSSCDYRSLVKPATHALSTPSSLHLFDPLSLSSHLKHVRPVTPHQLKAQLAVQQQQQARPPLRINIRCRLSLDSRKILSSVSAETVCQLEERRGYIQETGRSESRETEQAV